MKNVVMKFEFDDGTDYTLQLRLPFLHLAILRKLIESWVKLKNGIVDFNDLAALFKAVG